VGSAFATERALHCVLDARRVNARREFFRVSFDEARALFALLVGEGPADPVRASPGEQGLQSQEASLRLAAVAQTPEGKLRAWVEENYSHVPLREKDSGTKLETLYASYAACVPPVHAKVLGKILFAKLLNSIFPNIGPHKNTNHTANGIYLLR
jgi:hypothetical protein